MLDLSNPTDREKLEELISDDIEQFCSTYYESGHRKHLGASELGEECWRKLWYGFRWVKREQFSGRMLRLFNVGHSAEPRFITYLRGIGFEVREYSTPILNYHPESDSYFWSETFEGSADGMLEDVTETFHEAIASSRKIHPKQFRIMGSKGHYGGSLDGMCKAPERYGIFEDIVFLNEYKTNGTGAGYADVEKKGVIKAKPKHFAQMSQYGYKNGLKYGIYLIENKNDSSITVKIVVLDWNLGAQMERKAEEIIFAKEPPPRISDNPAFQTCQWCHQSDICHKGEQPEKNCRSCRNAIPVEDGEWSCLKFNAIIPDDFIAAGCPDWLPI